MGRRPQTIRGGKGYLATRLPRGGAAAQSTAYRGGKDQSGRTLGGPYENVDPVEYVGTELRGSDAIDKWTRRVRLFDIRINAFNYIEHVTGKPIRPARRAPSPVPD